MLPRRCIPRPPADPRFAASPEARCREPDSQRPPKCNCPAQDWFPKVSHALATNWFHIKLTQCHLILGPKTLSRSGGLCQERRLKFARLGLPVKRSFRALASVAQVSKPAVSRVSKPAAPGEPRRLGSRRYLRLGNPLFRRRAGPAGKRRTHSLHRHPGGNRRAGAGCPGQFPGTVPSWHTRCANLAQVFEARRRRVALPGA